MNLAIWTVFHNWLGGLWSAKFDDIIINTFFMLCGTLLGVILGDIVLKHGIILFARPIKRRYTMSAYDLTAKNMSYRDSADGKIKKFDLDGDFQREAFRYYESNDVTVKFYRQYVTVDTTISGLFEDKVPFNYRMKARGTYIVGNDSMGSVMLHGDCEAANKEKWKVAIIVKYGEPRMLTGYWIAHDPTRPGNFTIGGLRLVEIKKAA